MTKDVPGRNELRAYKDREGLTLDQLADRIAKARPDLGESCRPRTVQDILRGERSVSLNMAGKIREATGIAVEAWIPAA